MPFKIRTKLFIAFMSIIFFVMIVGGLIGYYILSTSHRALDKVEAIAEEIIVVGGLQHSLEHVLMPANDYLITGERKYIDDFNMLSREVEERLKRSEELLDYLEVFGLSLIEKEGKSLNDIKTAWQNIREISLKVFDIPNPIGNKDGARMMEEMDYGWGRPATAMLQKWHEGDIEEYKEAIELDEKARRSSWIIMASAATLLLILGAGFTAFYSKLFVRPIKKLHSGADVIAGGDFKSRVDVRTGDELEQLANAMNEMAAQLDVLYSNLNVMVEEKTKGLRESEERFRVIAETAADAIITMKRPGIVTLWNKSSERMFGYASDEVMGKYLHDIIVPERYREKSREGLNSFFDTGTGPVVGKTIEVFALRKDGSEFPVELSISAMRIRDEWQAAAIIRDITERKKAEDRIKEQLDYLERFEKVAVKREFRIKELKELNAEGTGKAVLLMLEDLEKSHDAIEVSKKEWEATFDSISDPLFIHDKEMSLVKVNRAYLSASGEAKFKDIIGRSYYEVFPKMDGPFRMCLKAQEMQEEQEEEFPYPVTNRVFKIRFYPIKDANGGYLYSIHILVDITEAKRAAEILKVEVEVTTHLLMISEATAHTTDIDKLMQQVVHCGHEIMRCDICLSYLYDEESKIFQPCQEFGLYHELIPAFRTEPIDEEMEFVRKAVEGKEPAIDQVGAIHESPLQWFPDFKTLAVIPLIGKTGHLGLIIGIYINPPESTRSGINPFAKGGLSNIPPLEKGGKGGFEFTDRDIKVMRGIMHQVSVALEQARLYKESVDMTLELSHKIETIKVMNQIDRSILSTLKADELLETVTRLISKVIPCDRATVSLVDRERDGFIYKAGYGTAIVPKGAFVPFADTSARGVVETGRTEHVNNLSEMRPLLPIEKRFLDEGFLSHIRVPITIKGDVAGILTVGAKRVAAFTKEDLSTLEYLCSQIGVALENAGLISDLEELFISVVKSLSSAIDAKSPWTAGHSERVTKYALDIAKQMGLSEKELKNLELTGLLHDVGKIGTYESILDKPAKLDDEELVVMRLHPVKGAEILAPIKQLKEIIPGVKYHHEFYDGTGYPDGLKGEAIPLYARILTVADTVDAMGADRPYREGRAMDVIIAELKRCSGTQFDPKVAEAFLKLQHFL